MERFVITIGREFGSLGLAIGKELAKMLNVELYDQDLIEKTAERLENSVEAVSKVDETVKHKYRILKMSDDWVLSDDVIKTQSDIITEVARRKSCIIVGRCSNYVLGKRFNYIHVYIYAPYHVRYNHLLEKYKLTPDETTAMIEKMDRERNSYYKYVTEKDGVTPDDFNIMINSDLLGIKGTALMLKEMIEKKFG